MDQQAQQIITELLGPEYGPIVGAVVGLVVGELDVLKGAWSLGLWAGLAGVLMVVIRAYRLARPLVWARIPKGWPRYAIPLGLGLLWAVATALAGALAWPSAIVSGLVLGIGAIGSHHGTEKLGSLLTPITARFTPSVSRPVSLIVPLDPARLPKLPS